MLILKFFNFTLNLFKLTLNSFKLTQLYHIDQQLFQVDPKLFQIDPQLFQINRFPPNELHHHRRNPPNFHLFLKNFNYLIISSLNHQNGFTSRFQFFQIFAKTEICNYLCYKYLLTKRYRNVTS